MEYHVYDNDAYNELHRERPGTEAEMRALVDQVWAHCEAEQQRVAPGHNVEGTRTPEQDRLLTAATAAADKQIRRITRRWKAQGKIRPWDATPQLFRSAFTSCLTDLRKKESAWNRRLAELEGREEEGTDDVGEALDRHIDKAQRRGIVPGHWVRVDDQRLELIDRHLTSSDVERRHSPSALEAVAVRMLRVLAGRDQRPRLTAPEAEVAKHYLELEWSMITLTEADLKVPRPKARAEGWRTDLADSLGITVAQVYKTTEKVLAFVELGLYLFIVLAPRHDAVVDPVDMGHLLDLTHLPQKGGLTATERMLLRKAGATLQEQPRLGVDADAFVRKAITELQRFGDRPGEEIVAALHDTELAYAGHVPGQVSPPRFHCVLGNHPEHDQSKAPS